MIVKCPDIQLYNQYYQKSSSPVYFLTCAHWKGLLVELITYALLLNIYVVTDQNKWGTESSIKPKTNQ